MSTTWQQRLADQIPTAWAEEITIATVNNADMIVMQKLSPEWEEKTGNTINWVVLEENVLRQRTTQDISTNGGSFDIIFDFWTRHVRLVRSSNSFTLA